MGISASKSRFAKSRFQITRLLSISTHFKLWVASGKKVVKNKYDHLAGKYLAASRHQLFGVIDRLTHCLNTSKTFTMTANAVAAYFISKQILPFDFACQSKSGT